MQAPGSTTTTRPPSISLLLRHIRLLDLDRLADYPHDLPQTFTAKPHVSNQKRRVQCTEWVLYQLFVLWDPDTARNKLRPFFPPLAPLQSLNLRAALVRCLTDLKKDGVLGRDVMIRKTMLDECKGERLVEVLAAFSTAIIRKRVAENESSGKSIAGRLATAQTLSVGDLESILPLVVAHRGSMSALLRRKEEERRSWKAFQEVMVEQEHALRKREVNVQKDEAPKGSTRSKSGQSGLKERLQEHWQGDTRWLDIIIQGEEPHDFSILNQSFEHARQVGIQGPEPNDIESPVERLMEQLEHRVAAQQTRLRKWKDYQAQFASPTKTPNVPKSWGSPWKTPRGAKGFTPGGVGAGGMTSTPLMTKRYQDFFQPSHAEEDESDFDQHCSDTVKDETAQDNTPLQLLKAGNNIPRLSAAVNETSQPSPNDFSSPCPPRPKTPSNLGATVEAPYTPSTDATSDLENWSDPEPTPAVYHRSAHGAENNDNFQEQSSPQESTEPSDSVKMITDASATQPKMSLLERTRQSIAFSSVNHNPNAFLPDSSSPTPLPRPTPSRPQNLVHSQQNPEPITLGRRTSLLDRTRQSISSVPARPRASRSLLILPHDQAKFPVNQFQTPRKPSPEKPQLGLDPVAEKEKRDNLVKMDSNPGQEATAMEVEGDDDYESVFKSRPRVGMSPIGGSPARTPTPTVETHSIG